MCHSIVKENRDILIVKGFVNLILKFSNLWEAFPNENRFSVFFVLKDTLLTDKLEVC